MNGAGLRRLLATTAMPRVSRSGRSPGGWDGRRPPSRRTCTTRLMLTNDLGIAPRVNAGLGATRAGYGRLPEPKIAPGLSRAERTPPWPGGAALRPIPTGARPYAGGATCARTRHGTPALLRYGTPTPTAPPLGWCLQRPRTLGRPGATRRAPPGHRRAMSARHTDPPASSRAERLRLCESPNSADRSQSWTSSSGWTSATTRSSSSRSASATAFPVRFALRKWGHPASCRSSCGLRRSRSRSATGGASVARGPLSCCLRRPQLAPLARAQRGDRVRGDPAVGLTTSPPLACLARLRSRTE